MVDLAFPIFVVICLMYVTGKLIELGENLWLAFEPVRKQHRQQEKSS